MNFQTPLSALFPGTSGRLLTPLVDHHTADADADTPLALDELSKNAAVTSTQLEAALLRLVLLGLIAWGSLRQPADLRDAVIEGTATHPVVKEAQAMGGTRAVRVFTG